MNENEFTRSCRRWSYTRARWYISSRRPRVVRYLVNRFLRPRHSLKTPAIHSSPHIYISYYIGTDVNIINGVTHVQRVCRMDRIKIHVPLSKKLRLHPDSRTNRIAANRGNRTKAYRT